MDGHKRSNNKRSYITKIVVILCPKPTSPSGSESHKTFGHWPWIIRVCIHDIWYKNYYADHIAIDKIFLVASKNQEIHKFWSKDLSHTAVHITYNVFIIHSNWHGGWLLIHSTHMVGEVRANTKQQCCAWYSYIVLQKLHVYTIHTLSHKIFSLIAQTTFSHPNVKEKQFR